MDGSLAHWLWTLGVLGLWLIIVITIYFTFLKKHIEDVESVANLEKEFFITRHQRD
jgi:hypothetical protein